MNSRKSTPPDLKKHLLSNQTRRKSCECSECGGISNLEVKTLNINYEIPLVSQQLAAKETIHIDPHFLKFANIAEQKRDSGLGRYGGRGLPGKSIKTPTNQRQQTHFGHSHANSPKLSGHRRTSSDKSQHAEQNGDSPPKHVSNMFFAKTLDIRLTASNVEDHAELKPNDRSARNIDHQLGSINLRPSSRSELDDESKSQRSTGGVPTLNKVSSENPNHKVGEWKKATNFECRDESEQTAWEIA